MLANTNMIINPNNKRKGINNNLRTNENNNKKQKNEDLLKIILSGNKKKAEDEKIIIDDKCPNPLCNHLENNEDDVILLDADDEIMKVNDITDLIKLGKTYHCKRKKEYYGINLRLLCKLVEPLSELNGLIVLGRKKLYSLKME